MQASNTFLRSFRCKVLLMVGLFSGKIEVQSNLLSYIGVTVKQFPWQSTISQSTISFRFAKYHNKPQVTKACYKSCMDLKLS